MMEIVKHYLGHFPANICGTQQNFRNAFLQFAALITQGLKRVKHTPALLVFILLVLQGSGPALGQNAIVLENQNAGNPASEWDVSGTGDLSIQGFATDISVNKGQTVRFKIKTNASAYTINIYRLGYYQGNGARRVGTGVITATLPQSQPADLTDRNTGLIDCGNWRESAQWAVPATAVSGIYIAKIIRSDTRGASHIIFIVRDDASTSGIIVKTSDATWQAYNGYGGNSLYVGNTSYPGGHAAKVSYNRPFYTRAGGGGGGAAEDWVFNAEHAMVRWLERNGYDLTYTTDVDADRAGHLIRNHKIFISMGHDEYWSGPERANVEAARNAGTHLAFFSSNEVYWKTRWEASIDGTNTAHRTLVCYKEGSMGENGCGNKCDPLANVWTGLWRDGCNYPSADGCKPENALTGQLSWYESSAAIRVPFTYKSYRFWRNTNITSLANGQTATLSNNTIGYEWDYEQENGFYPAGRVTMSDVTVDGRRHQLSIYRHSSGALVFGSGTGQWSWGLDGTHDRGGSTPDARMQQATLNLFADMGVLPGSLQGGLVNPTPANDLQAPATVISSPANGARVTPDVAVTISGTANESAGVVAGVEVSVDGGVTWVPANGTTNWTLSWTPRGSGSFTIKSRAVDDLANLETAATSTNTIQVSTNASNCTPPTATLAAAPANCQGNSISLQLPAATGLSPYTVVVNNQTYNNVVVGQSFGNVSTEQSIWGNGGSPENPNDNDGQGIEVGVKFRATQPGTITGIRFYKGNGNTGTHTGSLWSSSGTRLGTATFNSETASGWQEVRFTTPVSISANTTYIASYFSNGGGYASTTNGFTASGVTSGSLTALQSGADGSNGLYRLGSTGFPTSSYAGSNYWVDVLFKPSGSYTFNLTSITDANGCNNAGNLGSATVTQAQLQSGTQTFYRDADGDTYGNAAVTQSACTAPAGYVAQAGDCNDNDAAIRPGATEICNNGIDENCNGTADEGCAAVNTYYRDADGDGYGNPAITATGTTAPAGYVSNNTDCNDNSNAVYPGAAEICNNGIDENCNGTADEGCAVMNTYYRDADGDGYGNPAITTTGSAPPAGYVSNNTDCNDGNSAIRPGATEICNNGIDENCNGTADENCVVSTEQSVWGNTGSPQVPNDYDGQSIEVGVKFRASQGGMITGVRFYKGNQNTGTHVGSLWSATGTKLASATFANETASGWQEVRFLNPVPIAANTTFIASYFSPTGRYAATERFFATRGVTNGALTALKSGTDGANGVYRLGTTGFPASTYNSSNYWVDVLFKAGTNPVSIVTNNTGITREMSALSLKVLPNPTNSYFTLVPHGSSERSLEITVMDAIGRKIENRKVAPGGTVLIGQSYPPGSYYVHLVQGNEKVTVKIVKQSP